MKKLNVIVYFSIIILVCVVNTPAQPVERTVGLLYADSNAYNGYTLLAPNVNSTIYLIDVNGEKVHSWNCGTVPRWSAYLRDDGLLLRGATGGTEYGMNTPGSGGKIQLFDWDGTLVWDFLYADTLFRHHHDIEPLPNGNVLVIAWERKTAAEQIAAGRDSALVIPDLWTERIAEIRPIFPKSGEVVWIWHAWDHLIQEYDSTKANFGVVAEHPELINLNYVPRGTNPDWLHFNTVKYSEELDQIVLSPLFFNEIWVIDHSTSTAEAAGHSGGNSGKGGDLLYRWGNPLAYRNGDVDDLKLFGSHDAQFLKDTLNDQWKLLLFHNGSNRPTGNYSSADELLLPLDSNLEYIRPPDTAYGPDDFDWHYESTPPESLFSGSMSGVNRLPNGNTLICAAIHGELTEVTSSGEVVWFYKNPVIISGPVAQGTPIGPNSNTVFKARRYAPDFPGLAGKDLTPQGPIESYCCFAIQGDANGDGNDANILDLNFVINYLFRNSNQVPACFEEGDFNGDGALSSPNTLDLNFLINYLFRLGTPPPPCNYGPN